MCAADDDQAVEQDGLANDELQPEGADEELEQCKNCGGLRTVAERKQGTCAGCDSLEDQNLAGGFEEEDTDGLGLQLD